MAKELSKEAIVPKLAREATLDEVSRVLAVAKTTVPGEVRARYMRNEDSPATRAAVYADAAGVANENSISAAFLPAIAPSS